MRGRTRVLLAVLLATLTIIMACGGGGGGSDPAPAANTNNNTTNNATTTYSISGTITSSGTGTSGVTIALSGASTGTATTDASGNYSFTGLANGSYTVTPSKTGFTFNPTSSAQTVNSANITGVNFAGTVNSSSSGWIESSIWTAGSVTTSFGQTTATLNTSTTITNNLISLGTYTGYIGVLKNSSTIRINGSGGPSPFIFYTATWLNLPITLGSSWTDTSSCNSFVCKMTTTVNSVSDSITTLDGTTWNNCIYTAATVSFPNGYNLTSYPAKSEKWFCPGIGPVKAIQTINDNSKTTMILNSYTGGVVAGDYFPLTDGRTWGWERVY